MFVHPTHPEDTKRVNPKLPQSMVDYVHEITRTAMDTLVMGTRQKHHNCKVILSHTGGTLPYMIGRTAIPLSVVDSTLSHLAAGMTYKQIMDGFHSFYFDLALSTSPVLINIFRASAP